MQTLDEIRSLADGISCLTPMDRNMVVQAWNLALQDSAYTSAKDCPFTPGSEPHSLLDHTKAVTKSALALAAVVHEVHGIAIDCAKLAAAALTHDVGKLVETEPCRDGTHRKSERGKTFPHGFFSAVYVREAGLAEEIVQVVLAHTPLSAVPPRTYEGLLLRYADLACADIVRSSTDLPLNVEHMRV